MSDHATLDAMTKVETAAARWKRAKAKQEAERARLVLAASEAHDAGVSETQLAREAGVDRMTVRRWLGKL